MRNVNPPLIETAKWLQKVPYKKTIVFGGLATIAITAGVAWAALDQVLQYQHLIDTMYGPPQLLLDPSIFEKAASHTNLTNHSMAPLPSSPSSSLADFDFVPVENAPL